MAAITILGKYQIRREIGRGSFGIVYEGWDPDVQRPVAIKTVSLPRPEDGREDDEDVARFRREARAAGQLIHPNIVTVHDYGETGDLGYIVMEYVDGGSFKALIDREERLPPARIAAIMADLLAGLGHSHGQGIVHRDIKPANVLLTRAGRAKVADFGTARIENSSLTQTGTALGSPAYMAPEQFEGKKADYQSDIHSAGAVLFELVTGKKPFTGSFAAVQAAVCGSGRPVPSKAVAGTSAMFDSVVRKAMARRPEDRYQGAEDFAAALQAAIRPVERRRGEASWLLRLTAVAGAVALSVLAYRDVPWAVLWDRVPPLAGLWDRVAPKPEPFQVTPLPRPVLATIPPVRLLDVSGVPEVFSVLRDADYAPEMVLLPPGAFMMGVPEGEEEREKVPNSDRHRSEPVHKVTIARPFYMGRYPVTRGEYAAFIKNTGERPLGDGCATFVLGADKVWSWTWKKDGSWREPGIPRQPDPDRHPVVCVNHDDAKAYVAWLSGKTGQSYRLPSEAEWEYAARAVTEASAPSRARYWGDEPACLYANVSDASLTRQLGVTAPDPEQYFSCNDGYPFTSPVGKFRSNTFQLHDMLGNVWQWIEDCWHDDYKDSPPVDGSEWKTTDGCKSGRRVLRGASWGSDPRFVRAGLRGGFDSGYRGTDTGLRVARTYSPP